MKKKEQTNFKSTLLYHFKPRNRDKILEIYKEDRMKARIIFENDNQECSETSIYAFEYDNKDIRIVSFNKGLSFSKTNIIYSRDRVNFTFIYKHNTKSFYLGINKGVRVLTVNLLINYLSNNDILHFITNKFGWIRNIIEMGQITRKLSLTTILRKKLFNQEKIIKHIFGTNHNVAKILYERDKHSHNNSTQYIWKKYNHLFEKIDKLTPSFFDNHLLSDLCRFSQIFNQKINCEWGDKRIKIEHDKLYKQYIEIVLEFEPIKELHIRGIYKKFAEFSGYELLTTNHDLIREGKIQQHCVGTYIGKVNSGNSAILRVNGYTLEINYGKIKLDNDVYKNVTDYFLYTNQVRGFRNQSPPYELESEINSKILEFNIIYTPSLRDSEQETKGSTDYSINEMYNDLPF